MTFDYHWKSMEMGKEEIFNLVFVAATMFLLIFEIYKRGL